MKILDFTICKLSNYDKELLRANKWERGKFVSTNNIEYIGFRKRDKHGKTLILIQNNGRVSINRNKKEIQKDIDLLTAIYNLQITRNAEIEKEN